MPDAWELLKAKSTGADAWDRMNNIKGGVGTGSLLADIVLKFDSTPVIDTFNSSPIELSFVSDPTELILNVKPTGLDFVSTPTDFVFEITTPTL